jgi:hypothetical protein
MDVKESLPQNFEPVKYLESEKINSIFEITKSPDWEKTIPELLETVEKYQTGKQSQTDNYPYFTSHNTAQYLPKLNIPSEIFSSIQLKELHSKLPYYHQYTNLKRVFSISVDGCALRSFYDKCEKVNNSILVLKDEDGNIFGGYASEAWSPKYTFYGTGECFLFTYYKENRINIFSSTGQNDHYMYGDDEQICMGCSDDYFSLSLRNNFLDGYSKSTKTYNNESLNNKDKFTIVKLELWTFEGN